ncbi:DUF4124 domain-containing protein [Parendozoicomonas sp. Alg238-R29]|uniref:DUF4124 domain-containing protein n=1 Tax=Parendozoicomonas sp. Alg238-R29 TaxID=2993446 RepID=UPI00248EECD3|nr:DUF4124 domain-containing protein [Parendozoicomonas sp. Alg238-R29]
MKKITHFLLVMAMAATFNASAQDTVYKWTDSNGTVHFGKQPPEDAEFTQFKTTKVNTADGRHTERSESEREPRSAESSKTEEYDQQLSKLAKQQQEACRKATENKERLLSSHRIQMKDADGTVRTLSHEEKLEQLKRADEGIQEYCEK